MSDQSNHTEHKEDYSENDGRSVKIETNYYNIQTWGDPDDSFDEVMEKAERAADRAKADVKEMNGATDCEGKHYG